jgi:hypothetical protein
VRSIIAFLTAFVVTTSANAAGLFQPVPSPQIGTLEAEQEAMVNRLRTEKTTIDMRLVNIDAGLLGTGPTELNLDADLTVSAAPSKIDQRGPSRFTWYADLPDHGILPGTPGHAILVVRDGAVTGSIRANDRLYAIRPLASPLHVLLRIDESRFPPELEPRKGDVGQGLAPREPGLEAPTAVTPTTIEVLVPYTPSARKAQGGTANMLSLIDLAVAETNQSYQNSGVNIRLHLADAFEVSYREFTRQSGTKTYKSYPTILDNLRATNDGKMDEVHPRRDQVLADVVALIIDQPQACGMAYLPATASSAFAIVHHDCATGYYSFGHEIGHLQGAHHDYDQDRSGPAYAHGYKLCSSWRTVMAYDCNAAGSSCGAPRSCTRLPQWSNPDVEVDGFATGTAAREHNARQLNETAGTVAGFR